MSGRIFDVASNRFLIVLKIFFVLFFFIKFSLTRWLV